MSSSKISRTIFGSEGDIIREREAQAVFAAHASLIMGSAVVSPLIADLAPAFGVSEARAGLLIIVYTATLVVSIPFAGVLADRLGEKATVVPGLTLFGAAGGSIAFTTSFDLALGLRALQAIGVAFTQPILVAALGSLYTGTREATAQGIRVSVDSVLSTVTPIAAGSIFVLAWFYPFLLYFLTIPLAIAMWFVLPSFDRDAPRGVREYLRDLTAVLVTPAISLLMVSMIFRHMLIYGLYTYVSVLAVEEAHLAVVMIGILLGVRSVMKTISSTQSGRFVGAFDPGIVAICGFGLLGAGMFLMGILPTAVMLFVGIMLFGFGDGLLSPTQKTLVNRLSPAEYRNSVMSAGYVFVNAGKTIGPILIGVSLGFDILGPAEAFALLGGVGGLIGVGLLCGVWKLGNSEFSVST